MGDEDKFVKILEFKESPYYLFSDSNGRLKKVNSLSKNPNDSKTIYKNIGEEVILGRDIKEIPTRNIRLFFELSNQDNWCISFINECRKLASLTGADYFSTEYFDGQFSTKYLGDSGDSHRYIVQPRLFRCIPLDDRI